MNTDFSGDKNKLIIDNFNIISNDLFLNLKGEIIKPFSKKPQLDLQTEIKNTQINNLLYFIPDNAIFYRPEGIPVLKKSNFHGVLGGSLNIKFAPLDLSGFIKVEDIHIPNYPKPYRQNDANLYFMKDKLRVYTRVYTPDNEYVVIDGVSNLDDSLYGKYSVKSTNKINLKFAKMYLVPIQQIIGFNIGPVPIMEIDGYGNIDIKTQGTIKDAQIFGQFSAYSASASINGLDTKLTQGDCRLIFDNRNLIFKEIKGNLEGAKFLLTGLGNTKGEVELNVKIDNAYLSKILKTFNNSVLTKDIKNIFQDISASSGLLNSEINLKGTIKDYEQEEFLNELDLDGNLEFKNNKIILNNGMGAKSLTGSVNFDKKRGARGAVEFYINNSKFNTIFDIKEGLEKISEGNNFNLELTLNSQKCALYDILDELKRHKGLNQRILGVIKDFNDINFYSKISLDLKGNTSINNFDLSNFKSKGYIVGLNLSLNKNIKFIKGLIRIDNNNLIFDNFEALFYEGMIKAKGSSNNDLTFDLKNINLEKFDKLLPKTKLQNAILKSGEILIKKDNIKLNAINID
ncbi:hypothetical protein IJ531_03875 [bacterium]|nr:hypothetical protein [bacterium]